MTTTHLEVSPLHYHSRLCLNRSNVFDPSSWMSKTRLWELSSSTLWKWRFAPDTSGPTSAMTWGSLVDCLMLTPEEVPATVLINPYPDFRTKAAQELRDNAKAQGKIVVSVEDMRRAETAVSALMNHPIAGPVIKDSLKQVVLLNQIKGVNAKALLDIVPTSGPVLYDLKTTNDLTPRGISSTIHKYGYHVQAAWYLRLWNLCNPDDKRNRFRFIWQSSTEPFEVAVTELPAFDIESGSEWAGFQLDRIIAATKTGVWPGFGNDKVVMIGRPSYASYQDEEDLDGLISAPGVDGSISTED